MTRDERTELALRGAKLAKRLYWFALHNGSVGRTGAIQQVLHEELDAINRRLAEPALTRRSS